MWLGLLELSVSCLLRHSCPCLGSAGGVLSSWRGTRSHCLLLAPAQRPERGCEMAGATLRREGQSGRIWCPATKQRALAASPSSPWGDGLSLLSLFSWSVFEVEFDKALGNTGPTKPRRGFQGFRQRVAWIVTRGSEGRNGQQEIWWRKLATNCRQWMQFDVAKSITEQTKRGKSGRRQQIHVSSAVKRHCLLPSLAPSLGKAALSGVRGLGLVGSVYWRVHTSSDRGTTRRTSHSQHLALKKISNQVFPRELLALKLGRSFASTQTQNSPTALTFSIFLHSSIPGEFGKRQIRRVSHPSARDGGYGGQDNATPCRNRMGMNWWCRSQPS